MAIPTDMYIIECPRCGGLSCEVTGMELMCPNCLYHEASSEDFISSARTSSDTENSDFETLGENIEQIPSDFNEWNTPFDHERNLE